ncbi:MAG TPA: hypothetical protein DCR44_06925 [Acholeplasmatales bacterium]|nr:hypothetical protein [Acholeplasmatales bacterium]
MFLASFWDWAWPISVGLLAGLLIATRKHYDYSKIVTLAPEEFRLNMRRGQLVDLRSETAFDAKRINGARNFPKRELFGQLNKLRADMPVFLYDDHQGALVKAVAKKLVRKKFQPIYVLKGGFSAWHFAVKED